MARPAALLALLALLAPAVNVRALGVCDHEFCACTDAAHPFWTIVNCTVPHDQNLHILEGDLPESTTDIYVRGAEAVMFGVNSLARLKDARLISIADTKIVVMRKFAAINLNVVSVYLEITNCDVLRIEERTFSNIKGPLSVMISGCDSVSVEGQAFSWLLTMNIVNVRQLDLSSEAFMLDPTAANVGEHGPGMMIHLQNITIPEFAAQTFGSSAAVINMEYVEVRAIRTGAFSANTYNMVLASNSSFHLIESESFAQKSLINNFKLYACRVHQFSSKALQSGISKLNISHSRFENIETGAINATVAAVVIVDSVFNNFMERGFELSSWNKLQMERNSFDELSPNAIVAPGASHFELIFSENEIETVHEDSLAFIGQAHAMSPDNIVYKSNYFGHPCHCNVSSWLAKVIDVEPEHMESYEGDSYCTVDEFFARCFNVPEQNMLLKKFLNGVCGEKSTIQCERYNFMNEGEETEIKNPRFPHKKEDQGGLSDRNKKVIGIIIVTCLGCVIIAMIISLLRWMKRKGYFENVKNFLISSNSLCGSLCRLCVCRSNNGLDHARSISQLSVNEYSERRRLNEPRIQETIQETTLPETAPPKTTTTEQIAVMDDKTTQTLPEELTKELLENLKEKLEDPENYVEAREMIEHLYELIKVEESCNANTPSLVNTEENIYELPFQNTTPRIGKNKKQMISVGTRTPSLDKLLPLSPYNRQTALVHEYFEPKDFAVHLYAEIANCEKERRNLLGAMPDLVGDQLMPRGPYLRAKMHDSSNSSSPSTQSTSLSCSPQHISTIKSNKSTMSNSSGKMMNRPLPEKPPVLDAGEGTSFKHG